MVWPIHSAAQASSSTKFGGADTINQVSKLFTGGVTADGVSPVDIATEFKLRNSILQLRTPDLLSKIILATLNNPTGIDITLTIPQLASGISAGKLVEEQATATLKNKTMDGTLNTFLNLPTGALADNSVTSAKIVDGTIVNADISSSAAIAKSKLAALSIVDADVSSSAAIAKSKLAALGIVNSDVATAAAIAYSKLALTGSIVNADIASAAAIAYSKLALAASIVNGDIVSITKSKVSDFAHEATHISGGNDPFVSTDILDAIARYTERLTTDPASAKGRRWINGVDMKFWDDQTTSVKQTIERLANKGVASGYCDLDSSVLVPLSRISGLTNTQIASAAAIAYSKLNLATSIVNADIASAAAIVYSKLNLANSIVSGDLIATSPDFAAQFLPFKKRIGIMQSPAAVTGSGLLSPAADAKTGTATVGGITVGSTTPPGVTWSTGTTAASFGGWKCASAVTCAALNPYFRIKFKITTPDPGANSRLWIGFTSSSSATPNTDEPLANLHGIMFGYRSTDSTWMVAHNNASATSNFEVFSAYDSNWDYLEIWTDDAGAHWKWRINGGSTTTSNTTQLPTTSTALFMFAGITNVDTTSRTYSQQHAVLITDSPLN